MDRNLNRRVEVAVPILDDALKARVIREALALALEDNTHAWTLDGTGAYTRTRPGSAEAVHLQDTLLAEHQR